MTMGMLPLDDHESILFRDCSCCIYVSFDSLIYPYYPAYMSDIIWLSVLITLALYLWIIAVPIQIISSLLRKSTFYS